MTISVSQSGTLLWGNYIILLDKHSQICCNYMPLQMDRMWYWTQYMFIRSAFQTLSTCWHWGECSWKVLAPMRVQPHKLSSTNGHAFGCLQRRVSGLSFYVLSLSCWRNLLQTRSSPPPPSFKREGPIRLFSTLPFYNDPFLLAVHCISAYCIAVFIFPVTGSHMWEFCSLSEGHKLQSYFPENMYVDPSCGNDTDCLCQNPARSLSTLIPGWVCICLKGQELLISGLKSDTTIFSCSLLGMCHSGDSRYSLHCCL